MIPSSLLPQTVTINTRALAGARDAYGNRTRTTSEAAEVRARLHPLTTTELVDGRDVVTDLWRLYLPADVVIGAGDEVIQGTRRFLVEGTPAVRWGRGSPHHVEVSLRYIGDVA